MKLYSILFVLFLFSVDQRKPGSPLDHLPPNIEILTHFGERADFSPDNERIAFSCRYTTPRHYV